MAKKKPDIIYGNVELPEDEFDPKHTKVLNSTVDDRERRKKLRCSMCKPNRGENRKRKPKHQSKPKKKDHR